MEVGWLMVERGGRMVDEVRSEKLVGMRKTGVVMIFGRESLRGGISMASAPIGQGRRRSVPR